MVHVFCPRPGEFDILLNAILRNAPLPAMLASAKLILTGAITPPHDHTNCIVVQNLGLAKTSIYGMQPPATWTDKGTK